jgi:hypothetical protein
MRDFTVLSSLSEGDIVTWRSDLVDERMQER